MSTGLAAAGIDTAQLPVYVLTGPTGTGKSDWAIRLAQSAPVEIISVDSALVYRGLDIGAAKPAAELRRRVPHHLIDICDPAERYSAGRFVTEAVAAIRAVQARRRVPLLVGGTMLYLRALLRGLAPLPQASAPLRQAIDERAARVGWPALHAELAQRDGATAARIDPHDGQRIQRALEVCEASGAKLSELQRLTVSPIAGLTVRAWALAPRDRPALHLCLAQRFAAMMAGGFLEEVKALHGRGDLSAEHPSMRAVGYRQLWAHLEGRYPLTVAIERGLAATRQLAKRQITWMRAETGFKRLDPQCDELSWNRDVHRELRELGL